MGGFYSTEYKHLLTAERVLADAIESEDAKLSERSQCARALVDLVRLKRDMRGIPDPKPADMSKPKRQGSGSTRRPHDGPAPASPVVPTDAPKPPEPNAT